MSRGLCEVIAANGVVYSEHCADVIRGNTWAMLLLFPPYLLILSFVKL